MEIFNFAISLEIEGEKFYRDLSKKVKNNGIKNILNMLSEDEIKHKRIFENLRDNLKVEFEPTRIIPAAKEIFKKIRAEDFLNQIDEAEVYRQAQVIEQKSIDFYSEQVKNKDNEKITDIISKVLEEEKKHYNILENIIGLLMRPKSWVENGEFNHLEDF